MPTAKIDERGRILLPKEIRKIVQIKPKEHLRIRLMGKGKLLIERIPSLGTKVRTPVFGRPLHISLKKLKKIDLERIEEEMWSS
jgi:bifunctional DNA-binding transcriptional regulator/antitoxin component of YhaV-PrlF toxin-antitoxin module